jgi:crossover junction endodeoxyribonuclease RuvC
MRIIGIDTSLRSTGIGIIDAVGSRMVPVWYGTIKNPASRPLSACLLFLQDELAKLIETHHPDVAAIEGVFFAKNVKTMMILTHARGVMIAQCARSCIPVYEYEPRKVKMATAGYGAADKAQMQKMVKTLLSLSEEPQNDAADGLALAITHLHNQTRIAVQACEPI